jgi:hypothetical protein
MAHLHRNPNTYVFFYYNASGIVTSITTNIPHPVITEIDSAASTTTTSSLSAATLSTVTGGYTISLKLLVLPSGATLTSPVPASSATQNITSATSSSSASLSTTTTTVFVQGSSISATPGPVSNSGNIAGAAVGCLVGGALIAGILVWLIMSTRYKKRRSRAGFAQRREGSSNNYYEKPPPAGPSLGGAAGAGWEQHLPQSESDNTIRTSVKALFDQIELHVENFYRNATVSMNPEMQAEIMKIDSNYLPDSVVGLLPQTKTPTMLIKHCLAQLIVSRITPDSETSASFLPADFVALPRAMSGARANSDKPGKRSDARSGFLVILMILQPSHKPFHAGASFHTTSVPVRKTIGRISLSAMAISPLLQIHFAPHSHPGRRV